MKSIQILKNILILLLCILFMNCAFQERKPKYQNGELDNGKAIVDHLDHLLSKISNTKNTDGNFQESVVTLNEQVRQTIERNITNTQILTEIQTYLPQKKHAFSFVMSNDEKFGVFSWNTQKNELPIKNIGLYVSKDRVVPTSLYGNPINYDRIYTIQNKSGLPVYILGGFEKVSMALHRYHLSAYLIRGEGIEEARAFPDGESTITILCDGNDFEKCLQTKKGNVLSKSLYTAVAQQTLSMDGDEHVFD